MDRKVCRLTGSFPEVYRDEDLGTNRPCGISFAPSVVKMTSKKFPRLK